MCIYCNDNTLSPEWIVFQPRRDNNNPGRDFCRSYTAGGTIIPAHSDISHLSLLCSELPNPRRMADISGLSTRQGTITRTSVNASSITLNFDSFPFVPDLPAPGMRIFSALGKPVRSRKASRRRRIRSRPGGRLSVSPGTGLA